MSQIAVQCLKCKRHYIRPTDAPKVCANCNHKVVCLPLTTKIKIVDPQSPARKFGYVSQKAREADLPVLRRTYHFVVACADQAAQIAVHCTQPIQTFAT